MYYESLYGANGSKLNKELFDVNKQIASGLQIQYASDDVATFTETMRLDNELTTLGQVKQSTESGYKISNQSDVILNDFTTSMDRFRTLMVNAANDANSNTSRDAIALELRGLEKHLKNLANTSINGQYLFAGSAVDTKPIDNNGVYQGNDVSMNAFLGSKSQQQYNLTGADLFLGEEDPVSRTITTNALQTLNAPSDVSTTVTASSTMSEFMGDVNAPNNHFFYLRGATSNGTAIKTQIPMNDTDTVDDLLKQIGNEFGNTPNLNVVNVSIDQSGQISIEDKLKGSSKLDFHLVGATDFNPAGADEADIYAGSGSIDDLFSGSSDYGVASTAPGLYIKEFMKSPYSSTVAGPLNDTVLYDRTQFTQKTSAVTSNVSQIVKEDNSFATPSTKISEVADISKGTTDATDDSLNGTTLNLSGTTVSGAGYTASINFANPSTFTVGGNTYSIFNVDGAGADADDVTYRQMMDIINVVVTDGFPDASYGNTDTEYFNKIKNSEFQGQTSLTYDGKIQFGDANAATTKASISLYDANSGNFTINVDSDGDTVADSATASVMSFNTNNALTVRDPKTDFFKTIDEMIIAVENHKNYPDHTSGEIRNVGIQNAIAMMDDLQEHVSRAHSLVGAQSNTLTNSLERTELLEISTMTLRSSVIDTDLAEAALRLTQLTLNYEAMQYTVGKVSRLSLVNYL